MRLASCISSSRRAAAIVTLTAGSIAAAAAAEPAAGQAGADIGQPPHPLVGRSVVATRFGIVATSSPLASMAGVQMLERGGSAADAAIAANATLGLVEPMMNGIGGDLFAIVYDARTGRLSGLNASGWAPAGMTPALLAQHGQHEMPRRGILSVTVPGAVAGWDALHRRFGRLPLATLLAPAIHYAEQGVPVSEVDARMWAEGAPGLAADPGARATYLPDGHPPRAGALFRPPARAVAARDRDAGPGRLLSRADGRRAGRLCPGGW